MKVVFKTCLPHVLLIFSFLLPAAVLADLDEQSSEYYGSDQPQEVDPCDLFSDLLQCYIEQEYEDYIDLYLPENVTEGIDVIRNHPVEALAVCGATVAYWDKICEYDHILKKEVCKLLEFDVTEEFVVGPFFLEVGGAPDWEWLESKFPEIVGASCQIQLIY